MLPGGSMQRKEQGFTLIELMVTMAVMAIIAMMAAPSFSNMILSQNLNKSTQNLILTLNDVRSKAALERRNIRVDLLINEKQNLPINTDMVVHWKPSGDAILSSSAPTSLIFEFNGGVCIPDSGDPVKCLRPIDPNSDVFEICNKSGGTKSKIVSISRMGTIQQTTEGTC